MISEMTTFGRSGFFILTVIILLTRQMEVTVAFTARRLHPNRVALPSLISKRYHMNQLAISRVFPSYFVLGNAARIHGRRSYRNDSFGGHRYGRNEVEVFSHLNNEIMDVPEKKKGSSKSKKKKKKTPHSLYRADRVLANRSGRTRSECFKLLQKNAIFMLEESDATKTFQEPMEKENLKVIKGPKEKIPMNARIWINQKYEVPPLAPLLTVFHKPKWMLSTMGIDSKQRRNLQGLSFPYATQMHPVGRLDYDSSGLLLFCSSGPLTQALLHPKYEKEKEYVATVTGIVQKEELKEKLQKGVELVDVTKKISSDDDNTPKECFTTKADLLDVKVFSSSDVAPYLEEIRNNLPPEYNVTDLKIRGFLGTFEATELSEVRLVVSEGKHRMVRRMLATCGHPVVSLKRERMGLINLGDLKEGSFRNLTQAEEEWAQSIVDSLE